LYLCENQKETKKESRMNPERNKIDVILEEPTKKRMNTMEEYTKFVVMTEDALVSKNTSKMKWLGLESRRQAIQHEMIYLDHAIQQSHTHPSYRHLCVEYEKSIQANLKQMKDVIVELRLNQRLNEQIQTILEKTHSNHILHTFMGKDVYAHYSAGLPLDNLPFDIKKALHQKLKIVLDESI